LKTEQFLKLAYLFTHLLRPHQKAPQHNPIVIYE
jgi:hypothetical protein